MTIFGDILLAFWLFTVHIVTNWKLYTKMITLGYDVKC